MNGVDPTKWVDAIQRLHLPAIGIALVSVFFIRYALVPLIRAIRGKNEDK